MKGKKGTWKGKELPWASCVGCSRQALLTRQKDGAKASKVKFSTVPSSPSVLVGLSVTGSHRLASKGGGAVGQEYGSLNFP